MLPENAMMSGMHVARLKERPRSKHLNGKLESDTSDLHSNITLNSKSLQFQGTPANNLRDEAGEQLTTTEKSIELELSLLNLQESSVGTEELIRNLEGTVSQSDRGFNCPSCRTSSKSGSTN